MEFPNDRLVIDLADTVNRCVELRQSKALRCVIPAAGTERNANQNRDNRQYEFIVAHLENRLSHRRG